MVLVFLAGARELGPGLVLGGGDEFEEAGLRAADVAFRALFVQGVQAQEGVVVGPFGQSLDVLLGLFEACLQIGHRGFPPDRCPPDSTGAEEGQPTRRTLVGAAEAAPTRASAGDRKSVVEGKSGSVR